MIESKPSPKHAISCLLALIAGTSAALTQQPFSDPGVVPDEELTVVVGTHFVNSTVVGKTPREQFNDARIPLSAFNETDQCLDQQALEIAKDYFNSLGRALDKAGHYYFLPDEEIRKVVSICEKLHGRSPQAWVSNKTRIIAFGKIVPTAHASSLEESIR